LKERPNIDMNHAANLLSILKGWPHGFVVHKDMNMTLPCQDIPSPTLLQSITAMIDDAIVYPKGSPVLMVYDEQTPLSRVLRAAYQTVAPQTNALHFDAIATTQIFEALAALAHGSLVILIQSTHFRLDAYRFRVQLFNAGFKVIEHVHLARFNEAEAIIYQAALAYDVDYYHRMGHGLKALIDQANTLRVISEDGYTLALSGGLEPAKLNIGDYRQLKHVGGQFPIGEVFSEALDLQALHGQVALFAFGDLSYQCHVLDIPIILTIEAGKVTSVTNSVAAFDAVLNSIDEVEDCVWVREIGFGLNRAMHRHQLVRDIGTAERFCGMHLSLGAKHGSYRKPAIKREKARFHIDVFVAAEAIYLDQHHLFDGMHYMLP
jgi:hypothetical protein